MLRLFLTRRFDPDSNTYSFELEVLCYSLYLTRLHDVLEEDDMEQRRIEGAKYYGRLANGIDKFSRLLFPVSLFSFICTLFVQFWFTAFSLVVICITVNDVLGVLLSLGEWIKRGSAWNDWTLLTANWWQSLCWAKVGTSWYDTLSLDDELDGETQKKTCEFYISFLIKLNKSI